MFDLLFLFFYDLILESLFAFMSKFHCNTALPVCFFHKILMDQAHFLDDWSLNRWGYWFFLLLNVAASVICVVFDYFIHTLVSLIKKHKLSFFWFTRHKQINFIPACGLKQIQSMLMSHFLTIFNPLGIALLDFLIDFLNASVHHLLIEHLLLHVFLNHLNILTCGITRLLLPTESIHESLVSQLLSLLRFMSFLDELLAIDFEFTLLLLCWLLHLHRHSLCIWRPLAITRLLLGIRSLYHSRVLLLIVGGHSLLILRHITCSSLSHIRILLVRLHLVLLILLSRHLWLHIRVSLSSIWPLHSKS